MDFFDQISKFGCIFYGTDRSDGRLRSLKGLRILQLLLMLLSYVKPSFSGSGSTVSSQRLLPPSGKPWFKSSKTKGKSNVNFRETQVRTCETRKPVCPQSSQKALLQRLAAVFNLFPFKALTNQV